MSIPRDRPHRSLKRSSPWLWLAGWFGLSLIASTQSASHVLERTLLKPTLAHPFGFDAFGREFLVTVLRASAVSATFALLVVAATVTLGLGLGAGLAMSPGRARFWMLRALDFTLAFPALLLALVWAAIRGPGWDTLIVTLLLGILPSFVRLTYSRTRELLNEEYVHAATALGAGPFSILKRHLRPALLSIASVKAPGLFAHALMAEATLSFLGIGAPIGRDTWGSLLAQGKDYLLEAPHLAWGAGLPLAITVLCLQLISERHTRLRT